MITSDDPNVVADAIEKARREHPDWRQAHGTLFRSGRRSAYGVLSRGDDAYDGITSACALGFASAGGVEVKGLRFKIINWNDTRRYTLNRIIQMLRSGATD